jgi:hypothetical protein
MYEGYIVTLVYMDMDMDKYVVISVYIWIYICYILYQYMEVHIVISVCGGHYSYSIYLEGYVVILLYRYNIIFGGLYGYSIFGGFTERVGGVHG